MSHCIVRIHRIVCLSILAALAAWAQDDISQTLYHGKPLFRMVDGPVPACTVYLEGNRAEVVRDREDECWRLAIQAHNKTMNDAYQHRHADLALRILAKKLGKVFYEEP